MKNKIKILLAIMVSVLLTGCFGNMTPSEKVEDLLNSYIRLDETTVSKIDDYLDKQNLTKSQKNRYKEIIKDEYSSIRYAIKDETIDGDEAKVEVNIEVKDLYRADKEAGEYLVDNQQEFYTDGKYDESKFKDYKLNIMENYKESVKYNIMINLTKIDGIWTIEKMDDDTLEKIHGIYNYELETN